MATLKKEIVLPCTAERFWSAARDLGALHTRLVPGFVVQSSYDESNHTRRVEFGNGMVVTEPIISLSDEHRRLAWTAEGAPTTHYNAVLEVFDHPEGARVVWTTDLLPDEMADAIDKMQEQGLSAMKRAFPRGS